jgi:hypothetical protein
VELPHAIHQRSCAADREDLLQTLLEVSQKTEDTVVFNCSFERPNLFNEDFIKVAFEVLDLVQEVVFEEEVQACVVLLLQPTDFPLQQLF